MVKKEEMTADELAIQAEKDRLHNLDVAKEGSWLNALFRENNLSMQDKQEILRRVFAGLGKKELLQVKV